MKRQFFVVHNIDNTSLVENFLRFGEPFLSFEDAADRAKELAGKQPGRRFGIYELIAEAVAAVACAELIRWCEKEEPF